jgi:hypothetical protein
MTALLSEEAPKHDLDGIYAEPLTIHTFSQRNDERAGMPVCAVLLGANPESFRPKGLPCPTAGQRQSYLRTFRFVQPPAARTIHAPPPYRDVLLELYARLGVTISVAAPAAAVAADSRTGIKLNERGYGAIHFECIGPEAPWAPARCSSRHPWAIPASRSWPTPPATSASSSAASVRPSRTVPTRSCSSC